MIGSLESAPVVLVSRIPLPIGSKLGLAAAQGKRLANHLGRDWSVTIESDGISTVNPPQVAVDRYVLQSPCYPTFDTMPHATARALLQALQEFPPRVE